MVPGQRLDAIGGDRSAKTEFDPGILERARTVVEFEEQKRIKGEIRQMPTGFPVTEPRWIIIGHLAGLRHSDEVTLFDSAGFALKDHSALRCIREPAVPVGGSSSCRRSPTRGTCLASFGKQPGPPSTKRTRSVGQDAETIPLPACASLAPILTMVAMHAHPCGRTGTA